jgi:hypothetical protein
MPDDDVGAANPTIGVIADPEAAPDEIGRHLEGVLPELLSRRGGNAQRWRVDLVSKRLPAGAPGTHGDILDHASDLRAERSWAAVLCVTDLPLRAGDGRALVADLAIDQGVAVLSLPAFGATRLRRRVADVAVELVAELTGATPADYGGGSDGAPVQRLDERNLPGPFRLVTPDVEGVDAQVVASRAMWRQLVGMVRSNRPWRLILGLKGAIVAALAFSAFWLINPTVWQLGNAHSVGRLIAISLWAVTAIVVWLIVYHDLWERRRDVEGVDRRQVVLFNASTVLTLLIGVGIAHVGLLLLNLCVSYLVIDDGVLAQQLSGSAGFVEHLKLTWMATCGASVAGALGTGFESDESVREAAYSQREAERRRQWRDRGQDQRSSDPDRDE